MGHEHGGIKFICIWFRILNYLWHLDVYYYSTVLIDFGALKLSTFCCCYIFKVALLGENMLMLTLCKIIHVLVHLRDPRRLATPLELIVFPCMIHLVC